MTSDPQQRGDSPEEGESHVDTLNPLKGPLDPAQLSEVADMIRGKAPQFTMAIGLATLTQAIVLMTSIVTEAVDLSADLALGLLLPTMVVGALLLLGGLVAEGLSSTSSFRTAGDILGRSDEQWGERQKTAADVETHRYEVEKIRAEIAKLTVELNIKEQGGS